MKHARANYQRRIVDLADEDPSLLGPGTTPIAADEPVMLFRAQDRHFVPLLEFYAGQLYRDPEARAWQDEHGCKTPDLETGAADG